MKIPSSAELAAEMYPKIARTMDMYVMVWQHADTLNSLLIMLTTSFTSLAV